MGITNGLALPSTAAATNPNGPVSAAARNSPVAPGHQSEYRSGTQREFPPTASDKSGTKKAQGTVQRIVKMVKEHIYWILGLGVLYSAYHFRDSIPFLSAKDEPPKPLTVAQQITNKFGEYSNTQKSVGAGALLGTAVAAVAAYKHFSNSAAQEEESRSAGICDSLCSAATAAGEVSFWRKHGLKLGLVIIFLVGLAVLAFCLPGNEEQNDLECEEDFEWGP